MGINALPSPPLVDALPPLSSPPPLNLCFQSACSGRQVAGCAPHRQGYACSNAAATTTHHFENVRLLYRQSRTAPAHN
ncbi:hypothetical protein Ppro_2539 [Pelobacter propionicus DSM 2379]|uniref:Uncharacterized protein n=1 Tax=Pelobacter propionicus (strain DSM 2379 / NBRC 103807 / OttBd1) TaxID=338966 RepID=A1AS23_PELPD|nr:hypothetical protein Ppro_2539 [Pelobacter propionicus DSM 2379]